MRSFGDRGRVFDSMPAHLGVLLRQVDIASGREALYEDQLPELLRGLAQQTRIESVRASNAIEGVEVADDRADRLVRSDRPRLRNRNEKEFAGYADAIDGLMRQSGLEPPDTVLALRLHRQLFAHTRGRGGYLKTDDNLIVERDNDGRRQIVFEPPPWRETEGLLGGLFGGYREALEDQVAHPLVLLSALVLDFLAIHPVADGNGRVARLLTTHELLRLGYGVARYVSIEQRIFESKHRYYEALRNSQRNWHPAQHSIWPWTAYLVAILAEAYDDFERRVAAARSGDGLSKQERVQHWVDSAAPTEFKLRDVRRALPGVSDQTIRLALRAYKQDGRLRVEGSGPGATWVKAASS
jgi:Fic family protein